jgi:hypothetical protein
MPDTVKRMLKRVCDDDENEMLVDAQKYNDQIS